MVTALSCGCSCVRAMSGSAGSLGRYNTDMARMRIRPVALYYHEHAGVNGEQEEKRYKALLNDVVHSGAHVAGVGQFDARLSWLTWSSVISRARRLLVALVVGSRANEPLALSAPDTAFTHASSLTSRSLSCSRLIQLDWRPRSLLEPVQLTSSTARQSAPPRVRDASVYQAPEQFLFTVHTRHSQAGLRVARLSS